MYKLHSLTNQPRYLIATPGSGTGDGWQNPTESEISVVNFCKECACVESSPVSAILTTTTTSQNPNPHTLNSASVEITCKFSILLSLIHLSSPLPDTFTTHTFSCITDNPVAAAAGAGGGGKGSLRYGDSLPLLQGWLSQPGCRGEVPVGNCFVPAVKRGLPLPWSSLQRNLYCSTFLSCSSCCPPLTQALGPCARFSSSTRGHGPNPTGSTALNLLGTRFRGNTQLLW